MLIKITLILATAFSSMAVALSKTSYENSNGQIGTILGPLVFEAENGHDMNLDPVKAGLTRVNIRNGYILALGDGNKCIKDLIYTYEITDLCKLSGHLKNPFSLRVQPDYASRTFGMIVSPGNMVEVYTKLDESSGNLTGIVVVSRNKGVIFTD